MSYVTPARRSTSDNSSLSIVERARALLEQRRNTNLAKKTAEAEDLDEAASEPDKVQREATREEIERDGGKGEPSAAQTAQLEEAVSTPLGLESLADFSVPSAQETKESPCSTSPSLPAESPIDQASASNSPTQSLIVVADGETSTIEVAGKNEVKTRSEPTPSPLQLEDVAPVSTKGLSKEAQEFKPLTTTRITGGGQPAKTVYESFQQSPNPVDSRPLPLATRPLPLPSTFPAQVLTRPPLVAVPPPNPYAPALSNYLGAPPRPSPVVTGFYPSAPSFVPQFSPNSFQQQQQARPATFWTPAPVPKPVALSRPSTTLSTTQRSVSAPTSIPTSPTSNRSAVDSTSDVPALRSSESNGFDSTIRSPPPPAAPAVSVAGPRPESIERSSSSKDLQSTREHDGESREIETIASREATTRGIVALDGDSEASHIQDSTPIKTRQHELDFTVVPSGGGGGGARLALEEARFATVYALLHSTLMENAKLSIRLEQVNEKLDNAQQEQLVLLSSVSKARDDPTEKKPVDELARQAASERTVERLLEEALTTIVYLEDDLASNRTSSITLERQVSSISSENLALSEQVSLINSENVSLVSRLEESKSRQEKLETKVASLVDKGKELKQEMIGILGRCRSSEQAVKVMKHRESQVKDQLSQLEAKYRQETRQLSNKVRETQGNYLELHARYKAIEKERDEARSLLEEMVVREEGGVN